MSNNDGVNQLPIFISSISLILIDVAINGITSPAEYIIFNHRERYRTLPAEEKYIACGKTVLRFNKESSASPEEEQYVARGIK
jgi:hypothetical protein